MFTHTEPDGAPCWHMRGFLGAFADGTLSGLIGSYVRWHIEHCRRCQAALAALRALRDRLRALAASAATVPSSGLSDARWRTLEAAWAELDTVPP